MAPVSRALTIGAAVLVAAAPMASPAAAARPAASEDHYDPGRLAVTFERRVTRPEIDAILVQAGVTLEQAVPAIRAYMVGVAPSRRDSALASLRDAPEVASAGPEVLVDALDVVPNDAD